MAFDVVTAVLTSDDPAALMEQVGKDTAAWQEIARAALNDPRFGGPDSEYSPFVDYVTQEIISNPSLLGEMSAEEFATEYIEGDGAQMAFLNDVDSTVAQYPTMPFGEYAAGQEEAMLASQLGLADTVEVDATPSYLDLSPVWQDQFAEFLRNSNYPTTDQGGEDAYSDWLQLRDYLVGTGALTSEGERPTTTTTTPSPESPAEVSVDEEVGGMEAAGDDGGFEFTYFNPETGLFDTDAASLSWGASPIDFEQLYQQTGWDTNGILLQQAADAAGMQLPIDVITGQPFLPVYEGQRTALDVTSEEDIYDAFLNRYADDPYYAATPASLAQYFTDQVNNPESEYFMNPGLADAALQTELTQSFTPEGESMRLQNLVDKAYGQLAGGGNNPFMRTAEGLRTWMPKRFGEVVDQGKGVSYSPIFNAYLNALGSELTSMDRFPGTDLTGGYGLQDLADYDFGSLGLGQISSNAQNLLDGVPNPVPAASAFVDPADTFMDMTDQGMDYGSMGGYGGGLNYGTANTGFSAVDPYRMTPEQTLAMALADITRRAQYMGMDVGEALYDWENAFGKRLPQIQEEFAARGMEVSGLEDRATGDAYSDYYRGKSKIGSEFNRALGELTAEELGAWGGYSGAQFDKALKGGTDAARAAIAPELRKLLA